MLPDLVVVAVFSFCINPLEARSISGEILPAINCSVVYAEGTYEDTLNQLIHWQQECGITELAQLTVSNPAYFCNGIVPSRWLYNSQEEFVQVRGVSLDLSHVSHIASYAFATNLFVSSTIVLHLKNLNSAALTDSSLIGLAVLAELRIDSIANQFIPACLCGVTNTVHTLQISGPISDPPSSIDSLTATILSRIVRLELAFNLRDTINENTFLGMLSLTELSMIGCRIEFIGPNTFYPVRQTLRQLLLNDNNLSRLGAGVISALLPNPRIKIALHGNPWVCDCRLYEAQMTLSLNVDNFLEEPLCAMPEQYAGRPVRITEFCAPFPTVSMTPSADEATVDLQCIVDNEMISLQRRSGNYSIIRGDMGVVEIRTGKLDDGMQLIIQRTYGSIFNANRLHRSLKSCQLQSESSFVSAKMSGLIVQLFCVQLEPSDSMISAMNCVTVDVAAATGLSASPSWVAIGLKFYILMSAFVLFLCTIGLGALLGIAMQRSIPLLANYALDEIVVDADSSTLPSTTSSSISTSCHNLYESIEELSRFEQVRRSLRKQRSLEAEQDAVNRRQRPLRKTQSASN